MIAATHIKLLVPSHRTVGEVVLRRDSADPNRIARRVLIGRRNGQINPAIVRNRTSVGRHRPSGGP